MLLVKTTIGPSSIQGMGLFADEIIPSGTLVWVENNLMDRVYTEFELNQMGDLAKVRVKEYAWYDRDRSLWVLPGDDARFINHSDSPNLDGSSSQGVFAIRHILPGEELTENYRVYHMGDAPYLQ